MHRALGLAILASSAAFAQSDVSTSAHLARGQGWSVLTGATAGAGNTLFTADGGFPGLDVGVLRGLTQAFDLGARFTFNYAEEGITAPVGIPGVKLAVVGRFTLIDRGWLNFGLTIAPGFLAYFWPTFVSPGLSIPIEGKLGFRLGDAIGLAVGVDMPIFAVFGKFASVNVPLLFGAGVEYFVDKTLAVTLSFRVGPSFNSHGDAHAMLQSLLGVAFRL